MEEKQIELETENN